MIRLSQVSSKQPTMLNWKPCRLTLILYQIWKRSGLSWRRLCWKQLMKYVASMWKQDTWWWNGWVDDDDEKRSFYRALMRQGFVDKVTNVNAAYSEAKCIAKQGVWLAKWEADKKTFTDISPHGNKVFLLAKQMNRTNQDVIGEKHVWNDSGELSLSDDQKMKAWFEHYSGLLNVEFDWLSNMLPEVAPVVDPHPFPFVTSALIGKVVKKMKCGKAAGPL